jgi:glutamate-1-semialdehyde aminotransferase
MLQRVHAREEDGEGQGWKQDVQPRRNKEGEELGRLWRAVLPIDMLVNWMARKVKPDGKMVKKLIKQLVNEGFLIPHKKGETVSLNSAKSEEIIEYIKRFLRF